MRTLLTKSRNTSEWIYGNVVTEFFLRNYLTNEIKCQNILQHSLGATECISDLDTTLLKLVRL